MSDQPIALEAYEQLASAYASAIDTKPHNAYYERPATLSLLPDVNGKRVLDAGCGPGIYSEWMLDHGAHVIGMDASPKMVELARQRTANRADIRQADLAAPLDFLASDSIDLIISPLVLEYLRDWNATFREFNRVLRSGGHLIVSVTHPFFDFSYFRSQNYFATELVSSQWTGFAPVRVTMPTYRRSLQETLNPFAENGFQIERILEPLPTEDFLKADARHYRELMKQPCFLCIRARKPT
ncbi:MAG: class I SAM-dependent methyltransferase [Pseudohongiellaceae bacterium]